MHEAPVRSGAGAGRHPGIRAAADPGGVAGEVQRHCPRHSPAAHLFSVDPQGYVHRSADLVDQLRFDFDLRFAGRELGAGTDFGTFDFEQIEFVAERFASAGQDRLDGLTIEKATVLLVEEGLVLGEVSPENSERPIDTIISQTPQAGSSVTFGQGVDVVISAGKSN